MTDRARSDTHWLYLVCQGDRAFTRKEADRRLARGTMNLESLDRVCSDYDSRIPVVRAACNQQWDVVDWLLEQGVDANPPTTLRTLPLLCYALMLPADAGWALWRDRLLACGAKVPALHWVLRMGASDLSRVETKSPEGLLGLCDEPPPSVLTARLVHAVERLVAMDVPLDAPFLAPGVPLPTTVVATALAYEQSMLAEVLLRLGADPHAGDCSAWDYWTSHPDDFNTAEWGSVRALLEQRQLQQALPDAAQPLRPVRSRL